MTSRPTGRGVILSQSQPDTHHSRAHALGVTTIRAPSDAPNADTLLASRNATTLLRGSIEPLRGATYQTRIMERPVSRDTFPLLVVQGVSPTIAMAASAGTPLLPQAVSLLSVIQPWWHFRRLAHMSKGDCCGAYARFQ
jgi:hypothetical protein